MEQPRVYPNECVHRIIAFIPEDHMHVRFVVELSDQTIVLHEAVVAALVRAYALVATHPVRRAVELESRQLGRGERKPGYAEWQLLETSRSEEEVREEAQRLWARGVIVECRSRSE